MVYCAACGAWLVLHQEGRYHHPSVTIVVWFTTCFETGKMTIMADHEIYYPGQDRSVSGMDLHPSGAMAGNRCIHHRRRSMGCSSTAHTSVLLTCGNHLFLAFNLKHTFDQDYLKKTFEGRSCSFRYGAPAYHWVRLQACGSAAGPSLRRQVPSSFCPLSLYGLLLISDSPRTASVCWLRMRSI